MTFQRHQGRVWIEKNTCGEIIRIFKNKFGAVTSSAWDAQLVIEYPRKDAVAQIRKQIFERTNNECEKCGEFITWATFHMDEKIPRSKGGEVSLLNCQALCPKCHLSAERGKHGNRRPQFKFRNPVAGRIEKSTPARE